MIGLYFFFRPFLLLVLRRDRCNNCFAPFSCTYKRGEGGSRSNSNIARQRRERERRGKEIVRDMGRESRRREKKEKKRGNSRDGYCTGERRRRGGRLGVFAFVLRARRKEGRGGSDCPREPPCVHAGRNSPPSNLSFPA